uniref:Uncharacterized protein n=1 Tax=Glossina pallidipes TaxID=7398 RepID=A0A1B0AJE7_GLOPL
MFRLKLFWCFFLRFHKIQLIDDVEVYEQVTEVPPFAETPLTAARASMRPEHGEIVDFADFDAFEIEQLGEVHFAVC